jgi:hypothetical protein
VLALTFGSIPADASTIGSMGGFASPERRLCLGFLGSKGFTELGDLDESEKLGGLGGFVMASSLYEKSAKIGVKKITTKARKPC